MNDIPVHHVLYVEDEESDRFLMQRVVSKDGGSTRLLTVESGEQAIDYLSGAGEFADRARHPLPDLILLDLNLGSVSGFEVLQWIRLQARYALLPVVIFSSSIREEDHQQAERLGANAFLTKPHSPGQFSEVVRLLREGWLSGTDGEAGRIVWAGVISAGLRVGKQVEG